MYPLGPQRPKLSKENLPKREHNINGLFWAKNIVNILQTGSTSEGNRITIILGLLKRGLILFFMITIFNVSK